MQYETTQFEAYWLGDLPTADQEELEEAYFIDNETYQALLHTKDSLICRYLKKEMNAIERQRFEQHFLTQPGRLAEVALLRCALNQSAQIIPTPNVIENGWLNRWLGLPAYAGLKPAVAWVAVLLICVSGLAWHWWPSQTGTETSTISTGQNSSATVGTATLQLFALTRRGEGNDVTNKLARSSAGQAMHLQVEVEQTDYPSYCVAITKSNQPSTLISRQCDLKPQTLKNGDFVNLSLAAQALAAADYDATLLGVKADQSQVHLGRFPFVIQE